MVLFEIFIIFKTMKRKFITQKKIVTSVVLYCLVKIYTLFWMGSYAYAGRSTVLTRATPLVQDALAVKYRQPICPSFHQNWDLYFFGLRTRLENLSSPPCTSGSRGGPKARAPLDLHIWRHQLYNFEAQCTI